MAESSGLQKLREQLELAGLPSDIKLLVGRMFHFEYELVGKGKERDDLLCQVFVGTITGLACDFTTSISSKNMKGTGPLQLLVQRQVITLTVHSDFNSEEIFWPTDFELVALQFDTEKRAWDLCGFFLVKDPSSEKNETTQLIDGCYDFLSRKLTLL